MNRDKNANWQDIRKGSKTWRSRDKKLLELTYKSEEKHLKDNELPETYVDLHRDAVILGQEPFEPLTRS